MSEANTQQPTKKGKGKIRRNDFLLFLFILILAAGWMIFSRFQSIPGLIAQVSVDGQVVETLPLNQDGEFDIAGINGGSNHLIIESGQIWCSQATCPDHLCEGFGVLRRAGDWAACLPAQASLTIEEGP